MDLLAVELYFLVVIVAHITQAELHREGEHVCLKTETYKETIFVEVQETVQSTTKWCSITNIFYRFEKCRENKIVKKPRVVDRTRIILECCSGYEKDATNSECVPVCRNLCVHGQCTAPDTCSCESGFHGNTCQQPCPAGRWGRNCNEECDCQNGGECERVNGKCTCQPGWQGYKCESSCPEGYYGHSCNERCNCNGLSCNAVNGACPPTTTSTTTTTTTTSTEQPTTEMTFTFTTAETIAIEEPSTETIFTQTTEEATTSTTENIFSTETTEVTPLMTAVAGKETNLKKKIYSDVNNEILMDVNESKTSASDELGEKTSMTEIVFVENDIESSNSHTGDWRKDLSIFRFLPSLAVLSGTSVLLFILAARWLFLRHQKTMRKIAEDKIGHREEGVKPPRNIFTVNSIANNPIYVTDVELINATPVLKTFRPLKAETVSKNVNPSPISSHEGFPPSNSHNEDQHSALTFHIYEEIPIKVGSRC